MPAAKLGFSSSNGAAKPGFGEFSVADNPKVKFELLRRHPKLF
jgi:hypothetical protein